MRIGVFSKNTKVEEPEDSLFGETVHKHPVYGTRVITRFLCSLLTNIFLFIREDKVSKDDMNTFRFLMSSTLRDS